MTIQWTGTGGLYTRLGQLGGMISDLLNFANTTAVSDVTNIEAQYDAALQLIEGIESQKVSEQQAIGQIISFLQQCGVNTCNYMVWADNPQISNTDILISLLEIIRQMKATAQTVAKCNVAVSSITPYASNNGSGVCVATTYRADGLEQENLYAESITVKCTQDENDDSSLVGNEGFTVTGQVAVPTFDPTWPQGSGATVGLNVVNASQDNSEGNLLTNGSFEKWTSNAPNNWTIAVGTGGTTIKQASSPVYAGTYSFQFDGNGSELTSITQTFNSSTGTNGNVDYLSQYAFNCWIRCDTVSGQTGVLQVDLIDGNGNIVNDYSGNANSFTKTLSGLTVNTWTAFNGVFRLPQIMPTTVKLRIHLTTALSNATNLYIDYAGLGQAALMYNGGLSLTVFSGSSNDYDGDYFTVVVTNNRAGTTLNRTFQTLVNRLFDMADLGLLLPSSASPTISDSLIP